MLHSAQKDHSTKTYLLVTLKSDNAFSRKSCSKTPDIHRHMTDNNDTCSSQQLGLLCIIYKATAY